MGDTTVLRAGAIVAPVAALLLASGVAAQHFPPDEDLRLMLRYLVEDGEAPGVVLGVVEPDGSTRVVARGAGGADGVAAGAPLGPGSSIEIGTLTMVFTATLLADMVERGEVVLGDPVARYLPAEVRVPSPDGYEMTLGDLATHRSGLPAGPGSGERGVTVETVFERLASADLERPGRRYAFSTLGYAVLGQALARAAGTEYEDLLRRRVLEPLGMNATGYSSGGTPDGPPGGTTGGLLGATGLRSNGEDLVRFLRANVHPDSSPLGPAVRMAREIRVERGSPDEEVGYGFSWRTHSLGRQPPIVTHGGGTDRSTSMIAFDPDRGVGTVLLVTRPGFNDWIGRTLLFFDPPTGKSRAEVDPSVLRRYEGVYEVGPDRYTAAHDRGRYFIRLEDEGYLTYQPRGAVRTRLYTESDSTFYMLRGPYTLTFRQGPDAVRLVIHIDEREPESRARSWRAVKTSDDVPPPAVVAGNERSWSTWGAGRWALVALLGVVAVGAILRPLLGGRSTRASSAA